MNFLAHDKNDLKHVDFDERFPKKKKFFYLNLLNKFIKINKMILPQIK